MEEHRRDGLAGGDDDDGRDRDDPQVDGEPEAAAARLHGDVVGQDADGRQDDEGAEDAEAQPEAGWPGGLGRVADLVADAAGR
ncbi:hypothetical protein ACFPRL_04075 [Pseudoclavibacter helvolus]